ncbi:hypothetical protein F2Q68_00024591 [Brassica cretica]|uniref:Uncharacterized protein n=1 Tax=Brassica cretica TaxID=69181 RepID=A0A8S9IE15_BRACR|nr:hypothetical protein F2Q68_00024591 [Brassica cretica]
MDALADELLEELSLEDPLQHALTIEREAEVIENLESAAYGMMLDSHRGFGSKDQYEELPQVVAPAGSDVTAASVTSRSALRCFGARKYSQSDLLERRHEVAPVPERLGHSDPPEVARVCVDLRHEKQAGSDVPQRLPQVAPRPVQGSWFGGYSSEPGGYYTTRDVTTASVTSRSALRCFGARKYSRSDLLERRHEVAPAPGRSHHSDTSGLCRFETRKISRERRLTTTTSGRSTTGSGSWFGGYSSAPGSYYTTFPPDDNDAGASAPTHYP